MRSVVSKRWHVAFAGLGGVIAIIASQSGR